MRGHLRSFLFHDLPFCIALFILGAPCLAQADSPAVRWGGGIQFGGQLFVGAYGEVGHALNDRFLATGIVGIGQNEFPEETSGEHAIQALPYMEVALNARLFGGFHAVAGAGPTVYHFSPIWFTNVNGWFGLRYIGREGFSVNAGYSPRLYTSFSDPTGHYADVAFGLRLGILL